MEFYEIRRWRDFQHYRHRSPPWVKLHVDILTSDDWVLLADVSKLLMVTCMVVAARYDGRVPADPEYLKRVAYLDKRPDLTPLIDCGFLVKLQAPASVVQATASPETETETETETESERKKVLSLLRPKRNGIYDAAFAALWKGWRPHKTPKGSKKLAVEKWRSHVVAAQVDPRVALEAAAAYCLQSALTDTATTHVCRFIDRHGWDDDHDHSILLTSDDALAARQRLELDKAWRALAENNQMEALTHDPDKPDPPIDL